VAEAVAKSGVFGEVHALEDDAVDGAALCPVLYDSGRAWRGARAPGDAAGAFRRSERRRTRV
jgi:hypothetical protein